jgi:hypothetical protein
LGKKNNNKIKKSEKTLHYNTLYIHTNIPYLYITFCRIKAEHDMENKIHSIANWTNDQRQRETEEIRNHQDIVDRKNKEL